MESSGDARCFTLTELLVIIAVIGVIIAMTIPAVMSAPRMAAKSRWLSYSRTIRNDPALHRYYTFEEGEGVDSANLAVGRSDDVAYRADTYDALLADGSHRPLWIGKGGRLNKKSTLYFDGQDDFVAMRGGWHTRDKWPAATVAAWFKTSKATPQILVDNDRSEAWRLTAVYGSGGAGWHTTSSNSDTHDLMVASSAEARYKSLSDGKWHLVVGTYDKEGSGNRKRLFVDGFEVPVAQLTTAGTATGSFSDPHDGRPLRSTAPMIPWCFGYIGVGSNAPMFNSSGLSSFTMPPWFEGFIDEVLVFKRALAPGEVAEMYAAGKP